LLASNGSFSIAGIKHSQLSNRRLEVLIMQAAHSVGLRLLEAPLQKPVKFSIFADWGPANLFIAAAERLGLQAVDGVRWRVVPL
jgi:uncharacterized membrane protein